MMNTRVEMNEEMMEQVNGGYSIGDHVEVTTGNYSNTKFTKSATITNIRIDSETGETEYYVSYDHWYDFGMDGWLKDFRFVK